MEYLEFRRLLATDPDSRDPEFQRLKREDPKCAAAANEALLFERKLERALRVEVSDCLVDRIILGQATPAIQTRQRSRRIWAMAASVVIGFAIGVTYLALAPPGDIASSVIAHFKHEPSALMTTEPLPEAQVQAQFAEFDTRLAADLGRVTFAKRCPMTEGDGVHLVVHSENGPVTVFFMPEQQLTQSIPVSTDGLNGMVTPLGDSAMSSGSIAVIGGNQQTRDTLADALRAGLLPLLAGNQLSQVAI